MKRATIIIVSFLMILLFSVSSFAYYDSYDSYGEPDRDYKKSSYDEGYEDGFEDGGGQIIYKTREVSTKEYIADHETRFRGLYIVFLLVLGICVAPILIFRYAFWQDSFDDSMAIFISVVYNAFASFVITYVMYRIDYLVPCMSIVILWGIICRKILAD